MKRQVGLRTKWALKKLLEKAFLRELKAWPKHFTHNFSREKPYFEVTVRVTADEFAAEVMEAEISILQKKLKSAQDKIERLQAVQPKDMELTLPEQAARDGFMDETIHECGEHVLAHQTKTEDGKKWHRLVYCGDLPQVTSEWVQLPESVSVQYNGHHFTCTVIRERHFTVEEVDMGCTN